MSSVPPVKTDLASTDLRGLFVKSNAFAAFVHIALATFVAIEVSRRPWDVPFQIGYSNWTETEENLRCGEKGNICTISLEQKDAGVANIGILVPMFSFISGFHHAVAAYIPDKYILSLISTHGNLYRAVDYAFSSGLMIALVSVLFRAPSDPLFLVVVASLQFLTCFVGYAIEVMKKDRAEYGTASRVLFGVSILTYSLLWTSLLIPFGYAVSGAPAPVIVFITFMVAVFSSFPIIFLVSWKYTESSQLIRRELLYTAASFISKVPLLILFYTGVIMRSGSVRFEGLDLNTDGDSLSDGELYGLFGGAVLSGIVFGTIIILRANKIITGGACRCSN